MEWIIDADNDSVPTVWASTEVHPPGAGATQAAPDVTDQNDVYRTRTVIGPGWLTCRLR